MLNVRLITPLFVRGKSVAPTGRPGDPPDPGLAERNEPPELRDDVLGWFSAVVAGEGFGIGSCRYGMD